MGRDADHLPPNRKAILRTEPRLDCEYLRQWMMVFWDVEGRYERLRGEAGEVSEQ